MRCGNTLSHWVFKISNDIYWGVPPTLENKQTEPDKVKLFVNYMFLHKTGILQNTKLKRIYATSVLLFHESFLGIIGN